jgi:hypothetical protein
MPLAWISLKVRMTSSEHEAQTQVSPQASEGPAFLLQVLDSWIPYEPCAGCHVTL